MDTDNEKPNQGEWRDRLEHGSRQRIVNKIFDHLKELFPVSVQEGFHEVQWIDQMFEERIFITATSLYDYLRTISWKILEIESQETMATNIISSFHMLTLETESHCTMANNMTSNQVGAINKPLDPGDWRGQLHPGFRQRVVNELVDAFESYLPSFGQEGLHERQKMTQRHELWKMAQRFEEKIFTSATSQSHYQTKIHSEMLGLGTKFQGFLGNKLALENKSLDPGDWRGKLPPGTRERIVNKIMDMLKKLLPNVSGQEGSDEFRKIVQRFEDMIFTAATSKLIIQRK